MKLMNFLFKMMDFALINGEDFNTNVQVNKQLQNLNSTIITVDFRRLLV